MASLIRSAAVPCSGVLTAVRSAKPRMFGLREPISGIGRTRPKWVRTACSRRTVSSVCIDESPHARIAIEVALDVYLRFALIDAQLRRQPERRNAVDDAEVHRLGPRRVSFDMVAAIDAEDLGRGQRVDVFARPIGVQQQRIF